MYKFIDELNEALRLNESLGNLNTGSSEFREIVKVLLKQGKKTSVTPNSNIVNFTIDDISKATRKIKQITAASGENVAAIYLANAEGKGVIMFNRSRHWFEENITKKTLVNIITRDNGLWSVNGFSVIRTKNTSANTKFGDIDDFDMQGKISGAVIFSDPEVLKLRDDRFYTSIRNEDPLNKTKHQRDYDRIYRLAVHIAKKGGNYRRGEVTPKELETIIEHGRQQRGVVFEGIPVMVRNSTGVPDRQVGKFNKTPVSFIALEDSDRAKRLQKVAVVFEDRATGRYWLRSLLQTF